MARRVESQKSKLEDTSPMSSTEAVAEHSGVSAEDVTGPQELSFSDRQVPLTGLLGNLTLEDVSCDVGNIQEPLITMTGPTRRSSTVPAVSIQSSLLPVARPSRAACESLEVPAQPDVGRPVQSGFIYMTASSSSYEVKKAKVFPSTRGDLGSVTRPSRRPIAFSGVASCESTWANPTARKAPQGFGWANPTAWEAPQGFGWANPIDWKASEDPILINPATWGISQRPSKAAWNISIWNILISSRERIGLFLREEEHRFRQEQSQIENRLYYQHRFPMKKGSLITIFSLTEAGLLKSGEQLYVCEKFLMGTCQNDSSCLSYHTLLPFHWQFHHKDDNCWYSVPLGTQMHLEMIYANPNYKAAKIVYLGKTLFLDMKLKKFQSFLSSCFDYARRICCKSDSRFASSHRVFWYNGNKWVPYDQESGNPFTNLQNPDGTETESTNVHLEEMYLLKTSRPIYVPLYQNVNRLRIWHVEKSKTLSLWGEEASDIYMENHPYQHQVTMADEDYFTVIEMAPSEPAYQQCCQFFHNSISPDQAVVLRIYRYYNPYFWSLYQREKRRLKDLQIPSPLEYQLFCQTPFSLEELTMNGLCPEKGSIDGILGRGLYFSLNTSVLTSRKTINSGYMTVLAKVLIGERTLGNYSFYSAPRKENGQEYDACVNDMNMPTLFTVFRRELTYPYFIIFFKCVKDTVHLVY